jgi:TolB-like protein
MPSADPIVPARPPPTVFLSYASEDRAAAQAIRDALPALGLEAWYDESELNGGDAWDQKIRRQIRECDYFMALVSAQTEARHEGYFRREWRLAVERTLDMADDHTFLLPIVIDDTVQAGARVPERFLSVQWLRLPGGRPTPALEALCRRLVCGETPAPQPGKRAPDPAARIAPAAPAAEYPQFPLEEPGQRTRFWLRVIGWAVSSAWLFFKRFPRWVRILVYVWVGVALLSKGCSSSDERRPEKISPVTARKLKAISDQYQGSSNKADIAKLGAQIAREIADESGGSRKTAQSALLAIPFSAASEDPAAQKLADSAFAQVYGRVAISHHGQVGLDNSPLPSPDPGAAIERGRANHSTYVLYGTISNEAAVETLVVKIVAVADGSVVWTQSYPATGADPARIATEVDSNVPALEED